MSMHNKITVVGILICLLLAACEPGSQRRLDRETLLREKRLREPIRLKEADIIEAGNQQGQAIQAQLLLHALPGSSGCCPAIPKALLDSLENKHQAAISCYMLEGPLPPTASTLERQLLEAYQYNVAQNQPLESNIQPDAKDHFIYTAPVSNGEATKKPCAIWSIRLSRKDIVLGMVAETAP